MNFLHFVFPFPRVIAIFFLSHRQQLTLGVQSEESHQLNYQRLQSVAHNNNRTILTDNQIQRESNAINSINCIISLFCALFCDGKCMKKKTNPISWKACQVLVICRACVCYTSERFTRLINKMTTEWWKKKKVRCTYTHDDV